MKKVLILMLLFLAVAACSDKKNKLNDDIIDDGLTDNENLPQDKEGLPGDNDSTDNESSDDEVPQRECETVCGKGVEYFIEGTWQNCNAPKDGDKRD